MYCAQTDDMEPEEISELRARLVNWSDALLRLNRVDGAGEKLADKALGKFRITIDYVSKEVIEFVKNYDFESEKFKRIGKEIEALTKESVIKLAEYAKSVEVYNINKLLPLLLKKTNLVMFYVFRTKSPDFLKIDWKKKSYFITRNIHLYLYHFRYLSTNFNSNRLCIERIIIINEQQ